MLMRLFSGHRVVDISSFETKSHSGLRPQHFPGVAARCTVFRGWPRQYSQPHDGRWMRHRFHLRHHKSKWGSFVVASSRSSYSFVFRYIQFGHAAALHSLAVFKGHSVWRIWVRFLDFLLLVLLLWLFLQLFSFDLGVVNVLGEESQWRGAAGAFISINFRLMEFAGTIYASLSKYIQAGWNESQFLCAFTIKSWGSVFCIALQTRLRTEQLIKRT